MRTKIVELEGLLEATKLELSDANMKRRLTRKCFLLPWLLMYIHSEPCQQG